MNYVHTFDETWNFFLGVFLKGCLPIENPQVTFLVIKAILGCLDFWLSLSFSTLFSVTIFVCGSKCIHVLLSMHLLSGLVMHASLRKDISRFFLTAFNSMSYSMALVQMLRVNAVCVSTLPHYRECNLSHCWQFHAEPMIIFFLSSYVRIISKGLLSLFQAFFNKTCTRVFAKLAAQWDLAPFAAKWGALEAAASTMAPLEAQSPEKNHL